MADFRIRRVVVHDGAPGGGYLAIATVDVEWGLYAMQFRGMRIIQRKNGVGEILAMPSRQNSRGEHVEMVRPVNVETMELFEKAVIGEYHRLKGQGHLR